MLKINLTLGPIGAIDLTTGLASAIARSAVLKAIALCTVPTVIAIGWTATAVHAKPSTPSQQTIILKNPALSTPSERFPALEGIDLTSEQQEQIEQIRRELRPEFEAILPLPNLTPEQQNQLNSGQSVRISLPTPTIEQQAKLAQLREVYRQKVEAILTPEQKEQFRHNQDMIFFERARGN
jgi:Spy/CpxP family protein refolding chaperone